MTKISDLTIKTLNAPRLMRAWSGDIVHIVDRTGSKSNIAGPLPGYYVPKCNRAIRHGIDVEHWIREDNEELFCARCGDVETFYEIAQQVKDARAEWVLEQKEKDKQRALELERYRKRVDDAYDRLCSLFETLEVGYERAEKGVTLPIGICRFRVTFAEFVE